MRASFSQQVLLGFMLLAFVPFVAAQDMRPQPGDVQIESQPFSPYAGRDFPTRA